MKFLIALITLSLTASAFADGFVCQTKDGSTSVKVYNQTSNGVRNAAVMIFSDNTVAYGRKTIASFTSNKRTLGQNGTSYFSVVDLRVSESNRGGENILGTKLGQLKEIYVDVDFNYYYPVADGQYVAGEVIMVKRNGTTTKHGLDCARYLKN